MIWIIKLRYLFLRILKFFKSDENLTGSEDCLGILSIICDCSALGVSGSIPESDDIFLQSSKILFEVWVFFIS